MKHSIYILLIIKFLFINCSFAANIDSLQFELNKASEQEKIDIYIQLSKVNWTVSPSKGLFYANEAAELAETFGERQKQAKALLYGGVNAWFMGVYDNAIAYYQKSLFIARDIKNDRLCAYNLNNLGMVNSYLKNYDKAIEYYTESSKLIINLGDTIEHAKVVNNIAELNMLTGNLDLALEQMLSVIKTVENSNEQIFLIWLYNDIGAVYYKKNNYQQALFYYSKAINISNKIGNTLGKSVSLNSMGEVYLQTKEYEKASSCFFDALDLATNVDAQENINELYRNISDYYALIGNYKTSLDYFKYHKQLSDSILNENRIHTIVEMQSRYELETAENENQLLQKNIELQKLTLKKNKNQRTYLFITLLLTVLLIFLIYSRLLVKKHKNKVLNEKNQIINGQKIALSESLTEQKKLNETLEEQKKKLIDAKNILHETNGKLKEINATKDKFFAIIAHDLRGPIGNIQSFLTLINENINELSAEELESFMSMMESSAANTLELLENLLTWARSQRGEITFSPGWYDIKEVIEEAKGIYEFKAIAKKITIINQCKDSIICRFDRNMIKTTIANLLNNATKYTRQNGTVIINVQKDEDTIRVSVSDDGIGMNRDAMDHIFELDNRRYSTEGTEGEKGTGLGLILCREFVEMHKGEIYVDSEPGKGSEFQFSVPCRQQDRNSNIVL